MKSRYLCCPILSILLLCIPLTALATSPVVPAFHINAGLNDTWRSIDTRGQGFFITVFPDTSAARPEPVMFVGWFTYDVERPGPNVTAMLGEPGHRWLTAYGPYSGDTATLDIELTKGGTFDSGVPTPTQEPYGTMSVKFTNCSEGEVTYTIPSVGVSSTVPITRAAKDNVPLCESLAFEPLFGQLPRFQEIVPWTPSDYLSSNVDAWHFVNMRFCYDPTTKAVWSWSEAKGCNAAHDEDYPLADFKAFLLANSDRRVTIGLNAVFPDGTFSDRRLDGVQVSYVSTWDLTRNSGFNAYNLHDPRTKELFNEAYAAVIHAFDGAKNIIGWQIGYDVYQENLVGDYGFSVEALTRFKAAWQSGGLALESRLGPTDLAAVSALVAALDPASSATWPSPVSVADHANYTDSAENRAHRFYYAYFQKFRQRDLAALQKSLFDTVKAEAGAGAWVLMFNAQLYTSHSLPSPLKGPGYIQLGELPMLPVLDPNAPSLYSLGKDEGMHLHGYELARCATTWCTTTPGHAPYGVCASTRGDSCVCEPVENGCVDDWRLDRTVAYTLRDRAHGIRHRLNDQYVRSGYSVNGADWAYADAIRLSDFKTLDRLIFQGYGTVADVSFESQVDDSTPAQVRLYYPVWIQGAVPRLWEPDPYATGRYDSDFLVNLLESRGIKFQPINDDWSQLTTPVIVPYYDLVAPLLAEIPGYDPAKVIPQNTIAITSPSPVDAAYANAVVASIATKVPGLNTPITLNKLERIDPTNSWEPHWVLKVGAYNNVVYNLSNTPRCVGLSGGRTLRLAPFETRIVSSSTDDMCSVAPAAQLGD